MPVPAVFTPKGATDLQQNTELALHLLRLFEHKRDASERIWRGERSLRTLQSTCHVLEALHDLNLRGLTNHLAEPAANWLLALPLELPAEDLRAFRLFPGRLKTLAQLGKFDAARLMPDLEGISDLYDPATGWLLDAPLDLHPALATMLWVDTLLLLEGQGPLAPELTERRERALDAIHLAFEQWLAQAPHPTADDPAAAPGSQRAGQIPGAGDASYALDLLGRAGRLLADSPQAEAARRWFTDVLGSRGAAGLRSTDRLYCALHLQRRFPVQADTREVVGALLRDMRRRFENDECQREPLAYHALALRLLVAHAGEGLRTGVLEQLWSDSLATAEAEQRQQQQALEAEFTGLVRQSIRVHLTAPQRITGTRARGEVYRLRFGLTTESTDEHGSPLSTPRDTLRLIVKKGSPDILAAAIERYRNLPEPLQRLFARHADLPDAPALGYLIMQDLADMQPLSEVLAHLDRPVIMADERARFVTEAAGAVTRVLQGLHGYERRPGRVGYQLEVVYLAPMARALERLVQPAAFPDMAAWLAGPITINRRKYRALAWYLDRLRRHADVIRPPSLGYAHGDCHSRNVMLSRDLASARFVDIETLSSADDYVLDYGLLLEDIAVYQSLPYGAEAGRIEWDEIQTTRPRGAAQPGENWLTYPAFPRSEAVTAFQAELLRQLRAYAESIGDAHWQARLWLAIARGLLLLASHQLTSRLVAPARQAHGPRKVNDVRLVQVAYAEALRLLRELTDHLNPRRSTGLPELPFPGQHRAAPTSPQTASAATLVATLTQALGEAAERRPVAEQPLLTDFVTQPGQHLFARIHARDHTPVVYLAGRPAELRDPHGLAQPVGPDDVTWLAAGLGSRVDLSASARLPDIIDLVRQAYQLAGRAT